MLMKKLLLVVGLLFAGMTNHAQSNEYIEMARAVLETDTKEAIAGVMELDDSQSEEFWLLVNEYEDFSYFVKDKRIALIKDYAKNYESISSEKADEFIKESFAFKQEDLKQVGHAIELRICAEDPVTFAPAPAPCMTKGRSPYDSVYISKIESDPCTWPKELSLDTDTSFTSKSPLD